MARVSARRAVEQQRRERYFSVPNPISVDLACVVASESPVWLDKVWDEVRKTSVIKNRKLEEKRRLVRHFVSLGARSLHRGTPLMYSRNKTSANSVRLQVVGALVEAGYFEDIRAKKGSPRMSRLVPTTKLEELVGGYWWDFDPIDDQKQFVFLVDRETKRFIDFGPINELPANHIARTFQSKLEVVNEVNHRTDISVNCFDGLKQKFVWRKLRPTHYARFSGNWNLHGRIYSGKYGHQNLNKQERHTIMFNGCIPSVELDYSGLHARMLYHQEGINFRGDPYSLWGKKQNLVRRNLAKTAMNIMLNAGDERAALGAIWGDCQGQLRQLHLKPRDVYDQVRWVHEDIAHHFGTDVGMRLMRLDAAIALGVLHHFAEQGVPCLGIHDSFIVPETKRDELLEVMEEEYRERLGYRPVVKG